MMDSEYSGGDDLNQSCMSNGSNGPGALDSSDLGDEDSIIRGEENV